MTEPRPKTETNPNPNAQPGQGTADTQTKYRDRPSDDGKHGDAAAQPRPEHAREDAAGN